MTIRFRSVLVLAALLPACLDHDGYDHDPPDPPPSHPPQPPQPPECPAPCGLPDPPPLEFAFATITQGIGLAFDLGTNNVSLLDYEFTSTDEAIAQVEVVGFDLQLHALSPGTATIEARRIGDPRVVDSVDVTTATVDRAEVYVRVAAISPAPIASMAALPGVDSVGIRYRSATGELLSGRGAFTTTGAVQILPPSVFTLSEIFEFREPVALSFVAPGTGTLEIGLGDARRQSFPIEVLTPVAAAATTLELVPLVIRNGAIVVAPDPLETGEIMGVDLVARTPDGRFVGATYADWTAPVAEPQLDSLELILNAPTAPGPFDITATMGARAITRTLHAE